MRPPRRPGERAGLTDASVHEAARRIAERDGVERLTMRRLAADLGVAPNALYSHVPSKEALLDRLLDALLAGVAAPAPGAVGDWRAGLTTLFASTREVLLAHPALVPLYVARQQVGPHALRLGEATFALLAQGGVTGPGAVRALKVLLVYTLGFAAAEAPRRGPDADERTRHGQERMAAAEGDLPRTRELSADLARHAGAEDFATGLAWLLDGIAG